MQALRSAAEIDANECQRLSAMLQKQEEQQVLQNSCLFIFSSFSSCCCWARLILACAGVERARQTEGRFHLPSLVQSQLFTLFSPCFVLIMFVQDAYSR